MAYRQTAKIVEKEWIVPRYLLMTLINLVVFIFFLIEIGVLIEKIDT